VQDAVTVNRLSSSTDKISLASLHWASKWTNKVEFYPSTFFVSDTHERISIKFDIGALCLTFLCVKSPYSFQQAQSRHFLSHRTQDEVYNNYKVYRSQRRFIYRTSLIQRNPIQYHNQSTKCSVSGLYIPNHNRRRSAVDLVYIYIYIYLFM